MLKQMTKQIANSFLGMVINTALTILATKTVDVVYDKYFKKHYCFLCGGKGTRWKPDGEELVKVKCDCRKGKLF